MATKKVTKKQFNDDLEFMLFCYQTVIEDLDNTVKMIGDQGVKIPANITKGYKASSRFLKTVLETYRRLGAELDKIDETLPEREKKSKADPVKKRATVRKTASVKTEGSSKKKVTAKNKAKGRK